MLKVGGTVCYSTCSLNVIENEAVVNAVLRLCNGALEIIDCSNMLQGVKREHGM